MKIPVKSATAAAESVREEPRLVWTLRAVDRCDRCGAQAYVSATVAETPLLFCAHHFRKHEPAIRAVATEIVDERERLALAGKPVL